jgi:acyl carrier protein
MNANSPELDKRILELIAQVTPVRPENIKPSHRLREDLGMDSVCSMELLSMLAEELDLDVPMEEAAQVTTVAGAVEMARRHLAARGATA